MRHHRGGGVSGYFNYLNAIALWPLGQDFANTAVDRQQCPFTIFILTGWLRRPKALEQLPRQPIATKRLR